ncbi:uncharacterized protein LODBEIA_P40310 [Lodderomyces beijingensis]|uniref:Uncharacterized protein n=1 Tax=Lodderomyces beijingensis TaxID=1775926 RepID=A0ABP0ZNV4_9ASCO
MLSDTAGFDQAKASVGKQSEIGNDLETAGDGVDLDHIDNDPSVRANKVMFAGLKNKSVASPASSNTLVHSETKAEKVIDELARLEEIEKHVKAYQLEGTPTKFILARRPNSGMVKLYNQILKDKREHVKQLTAIHEKFGPGSENPMPASKFNDDPYQLQKVNHEIATIKEAKRARELEKEKAKRGQEIREHQRELAVALVDELNVMHDKRILERQDDETRFLQEKPSSANGGCGVDNNSDDDRSAFSAREVENHPENHTETQVEYQMENEEEQEEGLEASSESLAAMPQKPRKRVRFKENFHTLFGTLHPHHERLGVKQCIDRFRDKAHMTLHKVATRDVSRPCANPYEAHFKPPSPTLDNGNLYTPKPGTFPEHAVDRSMQKLFFPGDQSSSASLRDPDYHRK